MDKGIAVAVGLALAVMLGVGCSDDGGNADAGTSTTAPGATESRSQQICEKLSEEVVSTATSLGIAVGGTPGQTKNDTGDDPACFYDVAPKDGVIQPGIVVTELTGLTYQEAGAQFSTAELDPDPAQVTNTGDEAAWFQNGASTNLLLARKGDMVMSVQSPLLTLQAGSHIANQFFTLLGPKATGTTTTVPTTTTTAG